MRLFSQRELLNVLFFEKETSTCITFRESNCVMRSLIQRMRWGPQSFVESYEEAASKESEDKELYAPLRKLLRSCTQINLDPEQLNYYGFLADWWESQDKQELMWA